MTAASSPAAICLDAHPARGHELKHTRLSPQLAQDGPLIFELDVHDVPPAPEEDFMPPIASLSYRVLFYYFRLSHQ